MGCCCSLLAYALHRFSGAQGSLQKVFEQDLPLLKPLADRFGVDLETSGPVKLIREAFGVSPHTLFLLTLGVAAYGALELLEAVGLWLLRRWGEYVAVVGTSIFLPLEIRELLDRVTVLRLLTFSINVAAVAYLLWTKRLFGLRGGRAAFEAERHVGVAAGGRGGRAVMTQPTQAASRDSADRHRHGRLAGAGRLPVARAGLRRRTLCGERRRLPAPHRRLDPVGAHGDLDRGHHGRLPHASATAPGPGWGPTWRPPWPPSWRPAWSTARPTSRPGRPRCRSCGPRHRCSPGPMAKGWAAGVVAALAVGVADVVHRHGASTTTVTNIVLLVLAGALVGYVIPLARQGELAPSPRPRRRPPRPASASACRATSTTASCRCSP